MAHLPMLLLPFLHMALLSFLPMALLLFVVMVLPPIQLQSQLLPSQCLFQPKKPRKECAKNVEFKL
jgi:hypothetical protein